MAGCEDEETHRMAGWPRQSRAYIDRTLHLGRGLELGEGVSLVQAKPEIGFIYTNEIEYSIGGLGRQGWSQTASQRDKDGGTEGGCWIEGQQAGSRLGLEAGLHVWSCQRSVVDPVWHVRDVKY
jgi:hypothetical protein